MDAPSDGLTISAILTSVLVAAVLVFGQGAWAGEGGISDDDIGLRKGTLFNEEGAKPVQGMYSKDSPGKSKNSSV